jgi:ABC-2 type transport system ATP-binding protein
VANDPAIETTSLEKSYGRLKVLAGIDLRVEPGSIYSLLGPNGAGFRGHVLAGAKRR